MNTKLLVLTAAALLSGTALVGPATAATYTTDKDAADAEKQVADAQKDAANADRDAAVAARDAANADRDAANIDKELDARLEEARKRLEQAAHEIAELTSEKTRPMMSELMAYSGESMSRSVIGVQLDPKSGHDGARVVEVSPGGAAAEAGLHAGDIITSLNGTDIKGEDTARQVSRLMRRVAPDSKVNLKVSRDGKARDFVLTSRRGFTYASMHEPPQPPTPPMPPIPPTPPMPGEHMSGRYEIMRGPLGEMELVTLTPELGRYFGTQKGVLVVRAPRDFKLEDGDVILSIDGREPASGSHAARILGSYQPGEKVTMKLMRHEKALNLEATLPARGGMPGSGRPAAARMGLGGAGPGPGAGPDHAAPTPLVK